MVIGTPGRINDILSKHEEVFRLEQIKMVVFDEVDVMLHMGFQNQVIFYLFSIDLITLFFECFGYSFIEIPFVC